MRSHGFEEYIYIYIYIYTFLTTKQMESMTKGDAELIRDFNRWWFA